MKNLMITLTIALALLAAGQPILAIPPAEVPLPETWRFQTDPENYGVSKGWHKSEFSAGAWRTLHVPGIWEQQGVNTPNPKWTEDDLNNPYTGYAWYRVQVTVPAEYKGRTVYLNLGYVDDLDWTYWNGILIGQTSTRSTASDLIARSYPVPPEVIRYGKPNTIAVRVLDVHGEGGLRAGPLALTLDDPHDYGSSGRPGSNPSSRNDMVRVMGDVNVAEGQTVGDAVAVLGDCVISGEVTGDAVAVMGSVRVRHGGRVHGDAVAVGGSVERLSGATIGGAVTSVGLPGAFRSFPHFPFGGLMTWVFVGVLETLLTGLLAVITAALFPDRIRVIEQAAIGRPGVSAAYAVLGGAASLVFACLLLISCIGIPLIVVEGLLLLVVRIAGQSGVRAAIGSRVAEAAGRPGLSTLVSVIVGTLVLLVVGLVPLGGLIIFIVDVVGFGAALMTGLGAGPNWLPSRLSSQTPPPVPAP